jgi:hypothetical protein
MSSSVSTKSKRLYEWAERLVDFLEEEFPGIETEITIGPNYDEFSPHRTALHVRFLLPDRDQDWGEVSERVADLATDAVVDTGRIIYVLPGHVPNKS